MYLYIWTECLVHCFPCFNVLCTAPFTCWHLGFVYTLFIYSIQSYRKHIQNILDIEWKFTSFQKVIILVAKSKIDGKQNSCNKGVSQLILLSKIIYCGHREKQIFYIFKKKSMAIQNHWNKLISLDADTIKSLAPDESNNSILAKVNTE